MGTPDAGPAPWPSLRDTWWVCALAVVALGLFVIGFLARLRCGLGYCLPSPWGRLLDLSAVGGVPRLFTTLLFVGSGVLAWRARRHVTGRPRVWWTAAGAIAMAFAVVKLISALTSAEGGASAMLQLGVGLLLVAPPLAALWIAGRRWNVAACRPVVLALAFYAATALGLDAVTEVTTVVQDRAGPLVDAGVTFVEELGEALAALALLVVVRWEAPVRRAGP